MYCFHSKNLFYPPILICINLLACLSASLGKVILGFWWRKLPRSCRLLLESSALFCPLLSYSLSSVSLRDFFGMAHLTVAGQATSSYRNVLLQFFLVMPKLERAQFYAWLIESVVIRCTYCFCCFPYSAGCIETTQTTLTRYFSMSHFSLFHAIVF